MLLADVADTWRAVAAASARTQKIAHLAELLTRAEPAEVALVVAWLSGETAQRRTGIGWASLRERPAAAESPTLTVREVDDVLARSAELAGPGSVTTRRQLVSGIFGRATADEQAFLTGLLSGEIRQGALAGVMVEAVARAADVAVTDLRRAAMVRGSLPATAQTAMTSGRAGLAEFRLTAGTPVQPMLAQPASSVAEALAKQGEAAVEWKLDGVRVQIHRTPSRVQVFTRTLDDITARLPEVVALAAELPVSSVILDAEAIALSPEGRPRPFQDTAARAATRSPGGHALTTFVFDILHLDGADLTGLPAAERQARLVDVVPANVVVPRIVTADARVGEAFFADAVARGHEGVVVKSLTAAYDAGRRGAAWLKVKPVHTLDLVVLAAEWGHGRRRGWLSNLHLGARDPGSGAFVMLGKTFKGLTDAMLTWQTERLLALEESRNEWQVFVRPELVVEVAFDGVQTSPRYPGGMALRFARVLRYREDKPASEADTIDTVRRLHHPGPSP